MLWEKDRGINGICLDGQGWSKGGEPEKIFQMG